MASWEWVLGSEAGLPLSELVTATGRKMAFTRNSFPEAVCTIDHEDEAAADVFNVLRHGGTPQLGAYRINDAGTKSLKFWGRLAVVAEDSADASTLTLTFRGPFYTLIGDGSSRGRFTSASRVFTPTPGGTIAWTLIEEANAESDTLIREGAIGTTVSHERTYEHKNVGEAIVELTRLLDGFDFEVLPLNPNDNDGKIGEFVVYSPRQGSELSNVVFEYGPDTLDNVQSVKRGITPPVNKARVLGNDGLVGNAQDDASIAKYGLNERVESYDAADQASLDQRAHALLRPNPIEVVEFTPDPDLAPQPWDDYWLGDAPRFRADRGALQISGRPRINGVGIDIDDDGHEAAHTLAFELEAA
jgi:hypothetical protein